MENNMDGFYLDDGTKVDPNLIPKPGLCVTCLNNDDPSEEIACILTRIDQMDNENFTCAAYRPKRA